MAVEYASEFLDYLARPFDIAPGSRFYFVNWVVFLACGATVFALATRRGEKPARSPLAYIFPKATYLHSSTFTDAKLYLANFFVRLPVPGILAASTAAIATLFASLTAPVFGGHEGGSLEGWRLFPVAILVAMANDLVTYVNHRLSHESRVLWPFHAVHHSAEVMTPLTLYRKHPVYGFIRNFIHPFIAGPMIGLIFGCFGDASFATIFGVNMIYVIFNFAGANLRHSHIWISFGPRLSYLFVSPAMHQVHHSIAPRHYNKNYGEVFALWDWMFGSIYVPREREELVFGLIDEGGVHRVQPHRNLREAYVGPFLDCFSAVANQPPRPAPRIDSPPVAAGASGGQPPAPDRLSRAEAA